MCGPLRGAGSERRRGPPAACAGDLLPAAYLVLGQIAADHEGLELSVGEATVAGAVREATGVTRERLSALYRATGDLGDAAERCRHTQVRACISERGARR